MIIISTMTDIIAIITIIIIIIIIRHSIQRQWPAPKSKVYPPASALQESFGRMNNIREA